MIDHSATRLATPMQTIYKVDEPRSNADFEITIVAKACLALTTYIFLGTLTLGALIVVAPAHASLMLVFLAVIAFTLGVVTSSVVVIVRWWFREPFGAYAVLGISLSAIAPLPVIGAILIFLPPTLDETKGYCDRVLIPFLVEYESSNGGLPQSLDSIPPVSSRVLSNVTYEKSDAGYSLRIVEVHGLGSGSSEWQYYSPKQEWIYSSTFY